MHEDELEETFIRLLALVRDDQSFRNFFKYLINATQLERNLQLTKIIESMKRNGESKSLIGSVELLRQKEVFHKLTQMLMETDENPPT